MLLAIGSGCEVVLGILALLLVPLVLETSELTAFAVVETLLLLVPLIGAEFGATEGIVIAFAFKRLPAPELHQKDVLNSIVGVPWKVRPEAP